MTQTITVKIACSLSNFQDDLHKKLLEVAGRKSFDSIYMKKTEENWVVDEVKNIELKNGEQLRGFLLNSFDIVNIGSETESVDVKKEIFLLEDGELLVFNHIGKYFEEPEGGPCFYISYREIPEDQTLTAKEFVSLVETVDEELRNAPIEGK